MFHLGLPLPLPSSSFITFITPTRHDASRTPHNPITHNQYALLLPPTLPTDTPTPPAIHAQLNPFHTPTARPIQLLLSLIATPSSTQTRPSPAPKSAPSASVNVVVDILSREEKTGRVVVGYADGKTETVVLRGQADVQGEASRFPRVRRKQEESMSLGKLVERVDGWARVLKAREEGVQ